MENGYKARLFLSQIMTLDTKLKINLLEQEAVFNRAQGCGSIQIKERVQTSPEPDGMLAAIIELDELQKEYNETLIQYLKLKNEAGAIIAKIEKYKYRNLLRMRYCGGCKLEKIADEMGYALQTIKNMHRAALEEFGKKM